MRRLLISVTCLAGLLLVTGCSRPCLDLTMIMCDCCEADEVQTCKDAATEAYNRLGSNSQEDEYCAAIIDEFTCEMIKPSAKPQLCSGTYWN